MITLCIPMRMYFIGIFLLSLSSIGISVEAMTVKEYPPIGPQPSIVDSEGRRIDLYTASYALLISASKYIGIANRGWRRLDETGPELDRVAITLQKQGFYVIRVSDPNSTELTEAFRSFMGKYGRGKDNRLIFFFSGHGYTNPMTEMGYLVPIDALDPNLFEGEFFTKALPIESVQTWAKELSARHALFLFDSCFSGSIFTSKSGLTQPDNRGLTVSDRYRFFAQSSAKPVRQFIAAGGPNEELPAQSQFVPLFIEALGGKATKSNDGYVTGKEIGIWIEQILPKFNSSQTPHSDVIRFAPLSFGDMVFQPFVLETIANRTPTFAGGASSVAASSPSPTPETKVSAIKPAPQKVTFAADTFFDVEKASLSPEGRAKLDDLKSKVNGINLEFIIAVGHTDSFETGSELRALALSVARAETVKSYLSGLGVEKNRVYTEGKGRKQPVSDNKTAEGRAKNRRVEIEVVGTRPSSS